jgi:phage shock protein C
MSMTDLKREPSLYRSDDGIFLGVCRGLAEWRDIPVSVIRLVIMLSLLVGFFPTVLGYVVAAILIKKAPGKPIDEMSKAELYRYYGQSKREILIRAREKMNDLEKRTRILETYVTSPEICWSILM